MEGFAKLARLGGERSRLGQARTAQIGTADFRPTVRLPSSPKQKKRDLQCRSLFFGWGERTYSKLLTS